MKKLTKLLSIFVMASVVGTGVVGMAACDTDKPSHTHNYTYTDNGDGKHHTATCDGGDSTITDQLHVDADKDNVCDDCGGAITSGSTTEENAVTKVEISGGNKVALDGTLTLTATVTVTGNAATTVTWASSDETKATVVNGVVTGKAEGTVTITATSTVDATKKAEHTVTVVTAYEALMERSDKLAVLDSNYAEGDKLPTLEDYSTKGIYFRPQTGGSTAATDPARDYVQVIKEGEDLALQQHGSDGKTSGLPNVYTDIVIGAVSGTVEGYFQTKINALTKGDSGDGGQNPVAFLNNGSSVLTITAKGGNLSYKVGSGTATDISGVTLAVDTYVNVHFIFDLDNGKTTLKIGDVKVLDNVDTGITSIDGIELASSNKGARQQTTKNIVVCGNALTVAEHKDKVLADLEKEYKKYVEGETATHKTNATHVTAAYTDGVSALNAATSFDEVNTAYTEVTAAMKAVLSDAQIPAAIEAAKTALAEKFPAANYTINFAEGNDDAIYNNQSKYAEEIEAIESLIESGATTKAALDKIVEEATLQIGDNDAQLTAKKSAAVTALKTHLTDEALTEFKTAHAAEGAHIDAILADEGDDSAVVKINAANTIAAVNTALNNAISDIDATIANAASGADTVIANYKDELQEYGTAKKTQYADLETEIDNAVTAGKTEIGNASTVTVEGGTEEQIEAAKKAAAKNAYDDAKDAIDLIIAKYNGKAEVKKHGEDIIADKNLTDATLVAAINNIDVTSIGAAANEDEVAVKVAEIKTAIELLVTKYEAKLTVKVYGDGEKVKVVGRDDVVAEIENVDVSAIDNATTAADVEKAIDKVKEAIDAIISDLYNSYVKVTVGVYNTVSNVKYGATLTAADLNVTGMNVTAVYLDADKNPLPADYKVYADTTVYVDIADVADLQTSASWTATAVSEPTTITDTKVVDNALFSVEVSANSAYYSNGNTWKDSKGNSKSFDKVTIKSVEYTTAINMGNATVSSGGGTNEDNPLVFTAKSALSSVKIYVKLAGSNGKDNRSGNTYYTVNGGAPVKVDGIETVLELSNVNAGDVVCVYMENTNSSGGNMWFAKAEAELDTSKVPQLVTVEWLHGDGTVWKTEKYSYLDAITAPKTTDGLQITGSLTGWKYSDTLLTDDGAKFASGTTVQMTPQVATNDITINYADATDYTEGLTTTPLEYLSSKQDKEMPAPLNGDEEHLFLGYYLMAGDEPADTDVVFDLSTATAGTYTVYAKYMEWNVWIDYYDSEGEDLGEDYLFKLDNGKLVNYKNEDVTELREAPEAPSADTPEFKGWWYEDEEGNEVKLVVADIEAGGEYMVVAKFGEVEVKDAHLNQSNMPTSAVAANGTIADNALFTATASVDMTASSLASSKAITYKDGSTTTDTTFYGNYLQTTTKAQQLGEAFTITAKHAISLDIYYTVDKADFTGQRNIQLEYTIGSGSKQTTEKITTADKKVYYKLTVNLAADETLKIGYGDSNNSTTFIMLFGIDASLQA